MTLDQFLTLLEKTPRKWELHSGYIRCLDDLNLPCCPITRVAGMAAGVRFHVSDYRKAGEAIGLDEPWTREIAIESDQTLLKTELRSRLLAACGLQDDACHTPKKEATK